MEFDKLTNAQLWEQFQEFDFRTNPLEAPLARALSAHGFKVIEKPLLGDFTTTDWLASEVEIKGLTILFRQPTANELLVCQITRSGKSTGLKASILGVIHFFQFCYDECPDIHIAGGCISRWDFLDTGPSKELGIDSLAEFYSRYIGDVRVYGTLDAIWFFGDIRAPKRYETISVWKYCKRIGLNPR